MPSSVLLATEGTYPYAPGGVTTWCDQLVRNLPDVRFSIFAVVMNPYVERPEQLPANVANIINVPLWGTQDASEHRTELSFSDVLLKKRRTTPAMIDRAVLPLMDQLTDLILSKGIDAAAFGEVIAALHRQFQILDYQEAMKSEAVWHHFRLRLVEAGGSGSVPPPTLNDVVQAMGWIFRFFTVLNTPVPETDVIHSSAAAFCGLAGVLGKILYRTPYLLTEHGVYLREQYLSIGRSAASSFAKAFLSSLIETVVRCNLHFADELAPVCLFNGRWERRLGADPRRIRVVYNGVNPAVFHPGVAEADPGEDVRVLAVARIDPNKDLETLLRAAHIVHRRRSRVRFLVQGAVSVPAYHERVLALREALGLTAVVEFADFTTDIAAVYRSADIIVQASVSEAFPYSVVEAMMVGKAVVATEVGGTREALTGCGILVPAQDPARLAQGILRLVEDPELRRRLGQTARRRALELFTIDRSVAGFASAYRRLAGEPRPAAGLRSMQELALARGYALARLGLVDQALAQLEAAVDLDPRAAMVPAVLVQMAHLCRAHGVQQQSFHLIRARLVEDMAVAG